MLPPRHKFRAPLPGLLVFAVLSVGATAASGESLCLTVTMNDRPVGQEARLRLSAPGQPSVRARPEDGRARLDGLTPGKWTLQLQHPKAKPYRTPVQLTGPTALHLDCGYADEWSGCTVKTLPGGC